jgi:hypothetical protein
MKPRFSIANLLLFTAIVGLILGWILDSRQLNQRYQANTASLNYLLGKLSTQTETQSLLYGKVREYSPRKPAEDIYYYKRAVEDLTLTMERVRAINSKVFGSIKDIDVN